MKNTWQTLGIDVTKSFEQLWITNAFDGSEDYLVPDHIMTLVAEQMRDFQKELLEAPVLKNLKGRKRKNIEGAELLSPKQKTKRILYFPAYKSIF